MESDKSTPESANLADGQSSSSKQAQVSSGKVPSEQAYVTDSDIDAAKTAAMKAAELGISIVAFFTPVIQLIWSIVNILVVSIFHL